MAYNKTLWVNNNAPPISAEQLNKIEQGIYDAHESIAEHAGRTDNPHNTTAAQSAYASGVPGFTPSTVKAALDALAGTRIVEKGSNANGAYVRWENGLQVCYRRWEQEPNQGNAYFVIANAVIWIFPAAFIGAPAIFVAGEPEYWVQPWQDATYPSNDFGGISIAPSGGAAPTTGTSVRFRYFYCTWGGRLIINAFAIGAWK